MNEVVALVEGETEQGFVNDCLSGHLAARGVRLWARLPGRRLRRGGVRPWQSIRDDLLRVLRERRGRTCTTMFDFYALPSDWPGRAQAAVKPGESKGEFIEQAMSNDLAAYAGEGIRREKFIPYVQVHEFEALLFADVDRIVDVLGPAGEKAIRLRLALQKLVKESGGPEAINDNWATCPSRRIAQLVPAYRKRLHGPIIARSIGLETLRGECPHFGQWLARLEAVSETA